MSYQLFKEGYRLLQEGTQSLSLDGDNILQETGDALLLEITETIYSASQFSKDGFNSPALRRALRNRRW